MTERKKLNEILPLNLGLFSHMENPVWKPRYQSFDMDLEFITTYGERLASPLATHFARNGEMTESEVKQLANMIYRKYKDNWERRYAVLDLQYQIAENYNMIESEATDRDTLEQTIRELMRTNNESTKQLNDLMQILENDLTNKNIKTGTDSVKTDINDTTSTNQTETVTGTNIGTSTETQSFIDRKDTETRNLSKTGTNNDTISGSKTDELSFVNRKDTTSGSEKVVGTESDSGTSSGTDRTNTSRNGEDKVYAFNSTGPTPSNENNNLEDTTVTRNNTAENTKTTDSTTTTNGELTKTGTERHILTDTTTNTSETSESDKGTVETTKTGQEKNVRSDDFQTTDNKSINGTNISEGSQKTDTTYNTTETNTSTGTSTTSNKGSVETTLTGSEDVNETGNVTGSVKETRTLERRGNIGVTTTTALIKEHLELWEYNFLDSVYKDVASMLTLQIW